MRINKIGYHSTHKYDFSINRPNGSGDYVLLFLKTDAVFTLDGKDITAAPQTVMLYRKGTPQLYRAKGDSYIDDWLHFDASEEEMEEIRRLGIPFDCPTFCGDITWFSQAIKDMYQEMYSMNLRREQTLEAYLRLILLKLSEHLSSTDTIRKHPYYGKLSALRMKIYSSPATDWTIAKMAAGAALSESYFQHIYKALFGVSALTDVIRSRMEQAKYLLSSTLYPVSRIAEECGYRNDVHFMRQFRSTVGLTPSEYRKRFFVTSDSPRILPFPK